MNANLLTASPFWTAAGWTMLHLAWVGVVIGVVAVLLRKLLQSARPETRYGVALLCLTALSISPVVVFVQVFAPGLGPAGMIMNSTGDTSGSRDYVHGADHRLTSLEALRAVAPLQPPIVPARWRLDDLVPILPWFWLCGSTLTQVMLAMGLVGVERLRRSSRLVESGDIARRCCTLADSLGIARRVSVAICDRLAVPVLIGIVRPLILLPAAALAGWSTDQLEMVLLHELAHVRRWDNLVNLLQRIMESLLFFHPVVWWLSGWVRLERELCCDRFVVEQIGQPVEYAEMLVALSRRDVPGASAGARHGRSPGDDPNSSTLKSGGTFDEVDLAGRNRLAGCDGPGHADDARVAGGADQAGRPRPKDESARSGDGRQ